MSAKFRDGERISGDVLRDVLDEQISLLTDDLVGWLSELDGPDCLRKWHAFIRECDELINIEASIASEEAWDELLASPLDLPRLRNNPNSTWWFQYLKARYRPAVCRRAMAMTMRTSRFRGMILVNSSDREGLFNGIQSIADLARYLKARRYHFMTMLYAISEHCKGNNRLGQEDAVNSILISVERSLGPLTSVHEKRVNFDLDPQFSCLVIDGGLLDASQVGHLDGNFLEAERLSINDIHEHYIPTHAVDPSVLISFRELRAMLDEMVDAYKEFNLAGAGFDDLISLVKSLEPYIKDQYFVTIPVSNFRNLVAPFKQAPWSNALTYQEIQAQPLLGSHSAFVSSGQVMVSNLFMILRFCYQIKNATLNKIRRFQIRTGFIFENVISKELEQLGFVKLPAKRLEGREFDVVMKRDGVIYNFQCKNAYLDYRQMQTNRSAFVKNNRKLVRYFERALVKEAEREQLLVTKFGTNNIMHYVLCNFPVYTKNSRIISRRDINRLFG